MIYGYCLVCFSQKQQSSTIKFSLMLFLEQSKVRSCLQLTIYVCNFFLWLILYACTERIPAFQIGWQKTVRCVYFGARLCQRSIYLVFMFLFHVRITIWEMNFLFQLGSRSIILVSARIQVDCIKVHLNVLSWIFMFVGMPQMILYSQIMCSVCKQSFIMHAVACNS